MRNMHCGFHRAGNCWKWRFTVRRYATCTFYTLWRFFVSIDTNWRGSARAAGVDLKPLTAEKETNKHICD